MNVFLIGYRGSGKSAVGRELARRLGLDFVDTDEKVEEAAGKTIAEIFAGDGEDEFREFERREVLAACRRDGFVVALGGGAVVNREIAARVRESGVVVLLTAPAEVLHERITGDESSGSRRPDLTDSGGLEEVERLLEERLASYKLAAHFEVDTAGITPGKVAEKIESVIRSGEILKNTNNTS